MTTNKLITKLIIAIDGPAGSGKSTVAKLLAKELNGIYIDTGAMYRCIALLAIRRGLQPGIHIGEIIEAATQADLQFGDTREIYLNNQNVSSEIRDPSVTQLVSEISSIAEIRSLLVHKQRQLANQSRCSVVLDGRDIGTAVFPDAELKVYLTASPEIRAKRRFAEQQQRDIRQNYDEVLTDIMRRDHADMNRQHSPLRKAADATEIITDDLTIDQVVQQLCSMATDVQLDRAVQYLTMSRLEVLPDGTNALRQKLATKKSLRVKMGIDPTSPDLHLGHTVCLQLLRRFQQLGHVPVLIIGGFTAQLGDPSGRNEARPPLSASQVAANASTYLEQIAKILDMTPDKIEIVNNSDWMSSMTLKSVIEMLSRSTVNQMISKEAFGERLDAKQPLYIHELLYPVLQGYDSAVVRADIEIGGQDQRFNVLTGRDVQKNHNQDPQIVILAPLLVGLDGQKKMSKTSQNHIGINDAPADMYGKVMSLPDQQLPEWFSLLLSPSPDRMQQIQTTLNSPDHNPRDLKMQLARELVQLYHSTQAAEQAEADFITKFQRRELPTDIPSLAVAGQETISHVMQSAGMVSSLSEARRKIKEGAVKLNGQKLDTDLPAEQLAEGDILQLGRRHFVRISLGVG